MMGRYGVDQFSRFLMVLFFVLWGVNLFAGKAIIYYASLAVMIYMYFRIFSRDRAKRYQENIKYLQIKEKVIRRFKSEKSQMEQRKTHHIYKCPTCKQKEESVSHVQNVKQNLQRQVKKELKSCMGFPVRLFFVLCPGILCTSFICLGILCTSFICMGISCTTFICLGISKDFFLYTHIFF